MARGETELTIRNEWLLRQMRGRPPQPVRAEVDEEHQSQGRVNAHRQKKFLGRDFPKSKNRRRFDVTRNLRLAQSDAKVSHLDAFRSHPVDFRSMLVDFMTGPVDFWSVYSAYALSMTLSANHDRIIGYCKQPPRHIRNLRSKRGILTHKIAKNTIFEHPQL